MVDINAEPVCFAYHDHNEISEVLDQKMKETPISDFSTTNEIRHQLWVLDQPDLVEKVQNAFETIPAVYIADGHHRSASSLPSRFGKKKAGTRNS